MAGRAFQVIPVIDLKDGRAVHAVGGRRDHYRPIQSVLHPTSDPISLARAFHDSLGLQTLYVADLDAIAGIDRNRDLYQELISVGISLWIDAGVTDARSAAELLSVDSSALTIVAGLETLRGPRALYEIVKLTGTERVVFSLDLFGGKPLVAALADWEGAEPVTLVTEAFDAGVRQILVLELSRVGTSRGVGTQSLIARIHESHPSIRLNMGGGISRIEDVVELEQLGAAGVLIGTALHDGRIGGRELARLAARATDDAQPPAPP
jgi:phosphoribosylformimino-5-aminoimidazole carboxamide ribotide isomerase